jgi:Concanavalin A-like lectin/glucanases superfamily
VDNVFQYSTMRFAASRFITVCLCLRAVAGLMPAAIGAQLVAHWTLDETASPYLDSSGNGAALLQDVQTATSTNGPGVVCLAAGLNWNQVPGVATRLTVTNPAVQTDSFGFSFWLRPVYLDLNNNLIAKEMPYTSAVNGSQRIAWQLRISGTNLGGTAPLELIVRGNNPTNGSFFGNVLSTVSVPLSTNSGTWFHVAGGYDAFSGNLSLFVNGVQSLATNGVPGAHSSDGSPFDVGSVRNGSDFVASAPSLAFIDDLQLYNGPLAASDVAILMANPGQVSESYVITALSSPSAAGDLTITFNSTNTAVYNIEASTNLANFVPVATPIAVSDATTVTIPKANLDGAFGATVRPNVFFRIHRLVITNSCD